MQPVRPLRILERDRICFLLLALVVITPTLLIRWALVERTAGPHLDPKPDALEYAAAAQSLALENRYCLHVGPEIVRPRYAPGWPMILSVAIRMGMDTESLWRLTGLFGAAHAYLLAIITVCGVRLLLRSRAPEMDARQVNQRAFVAGACTGLGWAITPVSVEWGRTLMSDDPTAFLGNAALAASALAFLGNESSRRRQLAMLAAGVAAGLALAMRPIAGCLLLVPVLILMAFGVRLHGPRPIARSLLCGVAGLGCVVGLVMFTMHRSGYKAWEWSGYRFWIPQLYGSLGDSFSIRNATSGHPEFASRGAKAGEMRGNLYVAATAFLGLRGQSGLGKYWPITGWLCGIWTLIAGWKAGARVRADVTAMGLAVICWIGGHIVIYSLYFFPAVRFYLAPLGWCWVGTAIACAVGIGTGRRQNLAFGYVMFTTIFLALLGFKPMLKLTGLGPDPEHVRLRLDFSSWLNKSAAERAAIETPFDPVKAQALGLLTPEVLDRIGHSWGRLPNTEHVWRLKGLGIMTQTGE